MEFQLHRRDGRLCAVGEMTIYFAASMKEQLFASHVLLPKAACGPFGAGTEKGATFSSPAAAADDVLLDMSQVSELDTCGLQVLLMLQQMAKANSRRLTLIAPSAAVREVIGLCGLAALCGDDAAAKAA